MDNTNDVLKIHSAVWDEDEMWLRIKVSLLDNAEVETIFINDDGMIYYQSGNEFDPYFVDAPHIITDALNFHLKDSFASVFQPLLFCVIYPFLSSNISMSKRKVDTERLVIGLRDKINRLDLVKTKIAHFDDEDIPIEKMYRLHLEEQGVQK